ncbi:acetyltransferase [Marinomonas sp. SBI22]|uniref:GNAT family N-acetyltransferase n=1 Tax=unclassified Marinomonas TaxID=196814 RepID=UPI0007AF6EF2|nr:MULTISPECIES: GNAT family protein [unclassified Marinomonas]KZM38659.1 acetyltransferase [Marinomonas sp. SBI22]KZM39203.1 acetyltransferase [Marinomonas sp. SBI8L]
MQFSDERIKLLPFQNSDFECFLEIITCPQMMKHVYDPLTYYEAKSSFEKRLPPWELDSDKWRSFSISEIISGEKLGFISLRVVNHETKIAEVGFMIKASAQGKGIGSKALKLIKQYAFDILMLNKLVAYCSVDNAGSFGLLEKEGFIRENRLKQNTLINNQYRDDYAYGLSKPAL